MLDEDVVETAKLLDTLYKSSFSCKPHGRFRIAILELASLTQRMHVCPESINKISIQLLEKHGLIGILLGDDYCVILASTLRRYRKASTNVIKDTLPAVKGLSYLDEDEDDED
jgi:hypothetical protein